MNGGDIKEARRVDGNKKSILQSANHRYSSTLSLLSHFSPIIPWEKY